MSRELDEEDLDDEELDATINDLEWGLRFIKDTEKRHNVKKIKAWLNELRELRQIKTWLCDLNKLKKNMETNMKDFKDITELKDTVDLMLSDNFEDRLKAEFAQLDIRLQGLTKFLESEKFTTLSDKQQTLLKAQFKYMSEYFCILFQRLQDLGIE